MEEGDSMINEKEKKNLQTNKNGSLIRKSKERNEKSILWKGFF